MACLLHSGPELAVICDEGSMLSIYALIIRTGSYKAHSPCWLLTEATPCCSKEQGACCSRCFSFCLEPRKTRKLGALNKNRFPTAD